MLSRSFFEESGSLWRAQLTTQDFEILKTSLEGDLRLQKLPATSLSKQFFHQAPPWWQPQVTAESEVYGTPGFFKDDNNNAQFGMILWNPKTQIVYVWYYDSW